MITRKRTYEIFREVLPYGVLVVTVDREPFINAAIDHPFIAAQIEAGIYNRVNIYTDFLSPVRSYTEWSIIEVCFDLLVDHTAGLEDDLAESYLRHLAVHEAHHFHEAHAPHTVQGHVTSELACIAAVKEQYPDLEAAMLLVESTSPVYIRVYERIEGIKSAGRHASPVVP